MDTAQATLADEPSSPLEVAALLSRLRSEGVLAATDAHVAITLCRIGGESRPAVALAAALAVRAPRLGHTCLDLDHAADDVTAEAIGLALPSPDAWRDQLAASPLVADLAGEVAHEPHRARPLVLDSSRLYLDRWWRDERALAGALVRRATEATGVAPGTLRDALGGLEAGSDPGDTGAGGTERQRLAAAVAALRRLAVVTGPPGSGKTTAAVGVVATLHLLARAEGRPPPVVALAAPTGKAAARLGESVRQRLDLLGHLPQEVTSAIAAIDPRTLHRLLGVIPDHPTRFRHNAGNPLAADVVVVDEASMISLPLMARLVEAVRPDARLVLLGDRDQLASVEAGSVLGDICPPSPDGSMHQSAGLRAELEAAGIVVPAGASAGADGAGIADAVVRLTGSHRFGAGSGIGALARAVQSHDDDPDLAVDLLAGRRADPLATPPPTEPHDDIALVAHDAARGPGGVLADVVDTAVAVVDAATRGDAVAALAGLDAARVLCAVREGADGVGAWNDAVESALAKHLAADPLERWYPGRPVMVTRNDYGVRLFNGDVGVVVAGEGSGPTVAFPGDAGPRFLVPSRLPDHETAWASTVHKGQGSQFGLAVVVLPRVEVAVVSRELVYTGVTRARRRAVVVGNEEDLRLALARRVVRRSGLADALGRPD